MEENVPGVRKVNLVSDIRNKTNIIVENLILGSRHLCLPYTPVLLC